MENKYNFMGIIIPVVIAVILLAVLPILINPSSSDIISSDVISSDDISSDDISSDVISSDDISSEPISSEPKIFEVGDVLPATTQLKVRYYYPTAISGENFDGGITTTDNYFRIADGNDGGDWYLYASVNSIEVFNKSTSTVPLDEYFIIDTSSWTLAQRTVTNVNGLDATITWEDLNA